MKTAIIILSDPKSGSDEALGRAFNALALARESRAAGDEVAIEFVGAGTVGHVRREDRVALFLMDYPRRQRLKIDGRAHIVPAASEPDLAAWLAPPGVPPRAIERVVRITVTAFDWNCPKYITPRFTPAEVAEAVAPLRARIADLEKELAAARASREP